MHRRLVAMALVLTLSAVATIAILIPAWAAPAGTAYLGPGFGDSFMGRSEKLEPMALITSVVPISITEEGCFPQMVIAERTAPVVWTNYLSKTVHLTSVEPEPYLIYLPLVMRDVGRTEAVANVSPVVLAVSQDEWGNVDIAPGESYTHAFISVGYHSYFIFTDTRSFGQVLVLDTIGPKVVTHSTLVTSSIVITFDEPIKLSTFSAGIEIWHDIQPLAGATTLSVDGQTVVWNYLGGHLPYGAALTLTVKSPIQDVRGNLVQLYTGTVMVEPDTIPPIPPTDFSCSFITDTVAYGDVHCDFVTGSDEQTGLSSVRLYAFSTITDAQNMLDGTLLGEFAEILPGQPQGIYLDEDTEYPVLSVGANWFLGVVEQDNAGNKSVSYLPAHYFPTMSRAYVDQWYPYATSNVFLSPDETYDLLHGNPGHGVLSYTYELAGYLIHGNMLPGESPWSSVVTQQELADWLVSCTFATDLDPFYMHKSSGSVVFYYQGGYGGENFYNLSVADVAGIEDILTSDGKFLIKRVDALASQYGGIHHPRMDVNPTWASQEYH